MPKSITITYNFNSVPYEPAVLSDGNALTAISNTITDCVYDSLNLGLNAYDPEQTIYKKIYENIYIGGTSLTDILEDLILTRNFSLISQRRLGGILITHALATGAKIEMINPNDKNDIIDINFSGTLPTLRGDTTLSLLDKIFAFFGYNTENYITYKKEQQENLSRIPRGIAAGITNELMENVPFYKKNREFLQYKNTNLSKNEELEKLYWPTGKDVAPENQENDNLVSNELLANCIMLSKEYSIQQISDVSNPSDTHLLAGNTVKDINNHLKSKDSAVVNNAKKTVANIYLKAAEQLLKEKLPSEKDLKDFTHSTNPFHTYLIAQIAQGLEQKLNHPYMEEHFIKVSSANTKLKNKINTLNYIGNLDTINTLMDTPLENVKDDFDNHSTIIIESLRQYANEMIDFSGATLDACVANNQGYHVNSQKACHDVIGNYANRFCVDSEKPLDPQSLFDNDINVFCKIDSDLNHSRAFYKYDKASREIAKTQAINKVVDIFLLSNPDSPLKNSKDQLVSAFLNQPAIEKLFDKINRTNDIFALENDPVFYKTCMEAFPKKINEKSASSNSSTASRDIKNQSKTEQTMEKK